MSGSLWRPKRGKVKAVGNQVSAVDMFIDLPEEHSLVSESFPVEGWAFSTDAPVSSVHVLVDGVPVGDLEYGFERPDVARIFPHAGPTSGYRGSVRVDGFPAGAHTLLVRVTDAVANTSERMRPIMILPSATSGIGLVPGSSPVPAPGPTLSALATPDAAMASTTPAWPDGHFYSPVVNIGDVWQRRDRVWPHEPELLGIEFNREQQRRFLLDEFARYVADYDYPDIKPARARDDQFYTLNGSFGLLDSRSLFVMLRHLQPSTMIEVGSGFSSLLTADVNRRFLDGKLDFTCIEPYPNPFLLRGVRGISRLVQQRVEDVSLSAFERLGDGDILFIDSSHVSKTGSDVNYVVFEILPRLRPGVVIHFHDIPFPHEYPQEWVLHEGRSWNELYIIRALLMYTTAFEFLFGSSFITHYFRETVESMVGPEGSGGGSIWLKKL